MPVFGCFVSALQKKVKIKYAQKIPEILLFQKTLEGTKEHQRGPNKRQGALLARPPGWPRHLVTWGLGATSWPPLSPIFISWTKNTRDETLFSKPTFVPLQSRF